MKRCDDIRAGLDDWLDGLLEDRVRQDIESHLDACEACRAYFHQHQEMAGDFLTLADAANRIAAEAPGPSSVRVHRSRWPAIGIAAAILLVVGIGLYSARQHIVPRGDDSLAEVQQNNHLIREESTPSFDLTISEHCLARRVESDNPRIHIVWIVPETRPPEPIPGEDAHEPPTSSTHRL